MLKRNIVANYIGTGWTAIMGIAFVPLYVKYLGDEAYGVVGIAAAIQAYLSFLDAGLTPMLAREMARFTGGAHSAESIRSLLRVVELWAWTIGVLAMGAIWLAAPWIASEWLRASTLPPDTIAHALRIMAVVIGLRFIEGLYRGSLVGLQRQVTSNMVSVAASTFRGVGAIGVLVWWSPTLDAFFWWQGAVSLGSAVAYVMCTYSALPCSRVSIAVGATALRAAWPFAKGMLLSSFLVLALTQTDKVLLSRLLDLGDYGRYCIALVAASAVTMSAAPIMQAIYPRLIEADSKGATELFTRSFHLGAQLVSVITGTAAMVLFMFADYLMFAWTGDVGLATTLALPLRLLALGNLFAGWIGMVYQAQVATGWVRISNVMNAISVALVIPALLLVVPAYGMPGAAAVWLALNFIYLFTYAIIVLRRVVPDGARRWLIEDCVTPTLAALAILSAVRLALADHLTSRPQIVALSLIAAGLACVTATLASPRLRAAIRYGIALSRQ